MAESDSRPLADVLFGPPQEESRPNEDLAKVISAWFRAIWVRQHEDARFGTRSAEGLTTPRVRS